MIKKLLTSLFASVFIPLSVAANEISYTCLAEKEPMIAKLLIDEEAQKASVSMITMDNRAIVTTAIKFAREGVIQTWRKGGVVFSAGFTPDFRQRLFAFFDGRQTLEYHMINMSEGRSDRIQTTLFRCIRGDLEFKRP